MLTVPPVAVSPQRLTICRSDVSYFGNTYAACYVGPISLDLVIEKGVLEMKTVKTLRWSTQRVNLAGGTAATNRYFKIIRAFKRTLASTAALIVGMCLVAPTPSQAITIGTCGPVHSLDAINFGGVQIGFCDKSVTLSNNVLTIILTNTSPVANGGFIVADAFSLPTGIATFVSSTNSHFGSSPNTGVFLNGAVVVAPFLNRTAIISLGGTLANAFETFGGDPTLGIPVGGSATFVFNLVGATGATEQGIFDSELIRFSGFVTGAPGDRTSVSSGTQTAVPEPSTFWLIGTGLIGGGYWSRRRMIVESVLRGLK
jgi:PEP-CTERM motif-containing protein